MCSHYSALWNTDTVPMKTEHLAPTDAEALSDIINAAQYPMSDSDFQAQCKAQLDEHGVLLLPDFLSASAINVITQEGNAHSDKAYFTVSDHNAYLKPTDPQFASDHPRNRLVSSSKGCITTDQIPQSSVLRTLYDNDSFRAFLCQVLGEEALHEYADPLSSINLHYASAGQELGWHFDNSSFAITLLVKKPEAGGVFEYVTDVRDADAGDMNYPQVANILDNNHAVQTLSMDPGCLVLFRGRNALHRVTPTIGDETRMLVVLAYNTEPNVSLSESARITFYGRLN